MIEFLKTRYVRGKMENIDIHAGGCRCRMTARTQFLLSGITSTFPNLDIPRIMIKLDLHLKNCTSAITKGSLRIIRILYLSQCSIKEEIDTLGQGDMLGMNSLFLLIPEKDRVRMELE